MGEARQAATRAREAAPFLAAATEEKRNEALYAMASFVRQATEAICAANALDMEAAKKKGTSESILDRLMLNADRVEATASALEDLAALPDPTGKVLDQRDLYNDLHLTKLSVPIGVVAMVYEARPNVTADAAGICVKSGNASVLRGGSLAINSNLAIAHALRTALASVGLPEDGVVAIESTDRAETDELLSLRGLVDILIPRGGAGLIQRCVEYAKVPVIETGTGNCHVYVHETADLDMARTIILNAKTRRFGVCNAAETLLVDSSIARAFLPEVMHELAAAGVSLHCDEEAYARASEEAAAAKSAGAPLQFDRATEEDWGTEYLAPELAIKCVSGVDEAIAHVNRFGTNHSEAIVANEQTAEGAAAIEAFLTQVDAAAVYANASTAFTDGGQFGLGAEIGISTQKLHARGPFALEALTTYKYVVRGNGQVRS